MDIKRCTRESFSVIGKKGSTDDGAGFVQALWKDANAHYAEVASLAKTDTQGNPAGFWGAMSDMSGAFQPWEDDFTRGLYLAGVEVRDEAEAPEGWTKWTIPAYEYLYVRVPGDVPDVFARMIEHIGSEGLALAGAVQDFICPAENGQAYMFFPIRKL